MNCPIASMVLLASLNCFGASAFAAGFDPPPNGWASWEVPAVANAPAWCCLESSSTTACKLDDRNRGYTSSDGETTDAVRLYAHFTGGKVDRLRTLAADCAVESKSEIHNLALPEQTSVEWLSGLLEDRQLHDEALAALAVHRAPAAYHVIESLMFKSADSHMRGQAAFWLAHTGRSEAEDAINKALRTESDRNTRDQEIFALSRLPGERATRALIDTAQDKALPREDRKRAIFWLAQSGSDSALAYLDKVLANAR
jgi:hypothetical protein